MNFKKSRILMWVGMIIGILIMSVTMVNENPLFIAIGSILFFISIIQTFLFYTCPNCHYQLMNVRGPIPDYCPNCGINLKNSNEDVNDLQKGNDKQ